MDPVTALAFEMAESYLKPLLPKATLDLMLPYFNRAKEVLGAHSASALRTWPGKIEVIERGPVLHKPVIKPVVQHVIYQALLNESAINACYQPRGSDIKKDYLMHPLGVVSRMGVFYLVCTLWNDEKIKQFALHRFITAEISPERYKTNTDFNLKTYTREQQQFSYPVTQEPIRLKVLFEKT
ncbi:transcriptional regulator-like protein [methanotrophic bacterial endosymbiont of Bathymodiolus sp.]|nr:transcriptional regulator-like protein [methanotrophic bacterial endosymbiont of Bathymodiolus sp.]